MDDEDDKEWTDMGASIQLDPNAHMLDARAKLVAARQAMVIAKDMLDRNDPKARALSISITHTEDAVLRLDR